MSWVLWLCLVVVCWRQVVCESNDIAMEIQGRLEGRSSFIKLRDIDRAFAEARRRVNLTRPAGDPPTDPEIALLGTALQETTRILTEKFELNGLEILADLPRIDTSRTAIQDWCPRHLQLQRDCGIPGRYRSIDGSCNNLNHPTWGAARTAFRRLVDPEYGDGISSPRVGVDGYALPAARHVTSHVHRDVVQEHEQSITFMFVAWGQLIDHDLTLTAEAKDAASRTDPDCCRNPNAHPNCMPLVVPRDDRFYGYYNRWCIIMLRSLAGVRSGCRLGTRVQFNALTSYIDANFVYGSNPIVADSLRTFKDGFLRTVPAFQDIGLKPLLPPKVYQPLDGCMPPSPDIYCFLAGENRVNEQLALAVLHTMFVREHNRIAQELGTINPHWDDERLYQETRHIVAAVTQHITYNEFLPRLLGEETLRKYGLALSAEGYSQGYNDEVDASVPTAFAAAAFRFGHSLLPRALERWSPSHQYIGARRLSSVIQRPFDLYKPGAYDLYLLGMVNQLAMAMDSSVTEEVTNHLFQPPDSEFGRDLAATNLGRGRENGIPGINRYRRLCGLPEINSWDEMHHHMPNSTVSDYHFMYSHPDDVDLWSAGVSERPLRGSIVGPTFNCLIALTFRDLKRGDRFWYENGDWPSSFTPDQLRSIKSIRLSRLICDSSDTIETVQMRAMEVHHFKTNPRVSCASNRLPHLDLRLWREDRENEDINETGFNKPGAIILTEETDNLENNVSPPEYSDY